MELKQLEYFLEASKCGSFNKAAANLFTSQPNVSKVVNSLETELGYHLFQRTTKGLVLTDDGRRIKTYAENMINMSREILQKPKDLDNVLNISTYRSNLISHLLVDLYNDIDGLKMNHNQCSAQQITNDVESKVSELGVVYIATDQLQKFKNILNHKNLEFTPLATKETCVFVGPNSKYFKQDVISMEQLSKLKFVRGNEDYFSVEQNFEPINFGALATDQLSFDIFTNSDHLYLDVLLRTEIASLGVDFFCEKCQHNNIKSLKIKGAEPYLTIGIVSPKDSELSNNAIDFISKLKSRL